MKFLDCNLFIRALGYALFKSNQDGVSGYGDISIDDMKAHLHEYLESNNDVKDTRVDTIHAILRLDFFRNLYKRRTIENNIGGKIRKIPSQTLSRCHP